MKKSRLKFVLLIISLYVLHLMISCPAKGPVWKKKFDDERAVRVYFRQPPMWYAPHVFWFWDAPVDPESAASMAGEITAQHLNPGYVHARHSGDPDKPYPLLPKEQWLSPLWFSAYESALQKARKAGFTLGYCDEYWWPSGQAAGRVLQSHPELRAQSLGWIRREIYGPTTVSFPASEFTVAARRDIDGLLDSGTLIVIGSGEPFDWSVPEGQWNIYSFTVYHHKGIDGGEVNYLDPRLMDIFIPIAHQPYEERFGRHMGRTIPGVFVDHEGDFGWKLAWSEYLPVRYSDMKGRDIRQWMPLLFERDSEGFWARARFDWFDVVSDIYCRCFLGRLSAWLEERQMYCISNLWEESLIRQTRAVGDFMRAQRSVTIPGNDCLEMKSQEVHDFKETQSVCEFEDRPFMSEIMGVAGWEQTPVQMKKSLNAVIAWGVTHIVPHGINMNRKLQTIPYPADWFTENPYWRYIHLWADFARRAGFVNRQGQLVADILLIDPLESIWALSESYFSMEDIARWNELGFEIDGSYAACMDILTECNLDYLIADGYYMAQANVTRADEKNDPSRSPHIRIGEHEFSIVILPPMVICAHTTMQKVVEFAEAGGVVVLLGALPTGSPEKGASDPIIRDLSAKLAECSTVVDVSDHRDRIDVLPELLMERIRPQIRMLKGDLSLFTCHRRIGRSDFYWLANNDDRGQSCRLAIRDGGGRAEIWDCETGEIHAATCLESEDGMLFEHDFASCEAFWLVFNPDKPADPSGEQIAVEKTGTGRRNEFVLSGPWDLSFPESDTIRVSSCLMRLLPEPSSDGFPFMSDGLETDWEWHRFIGPVRRRDSWHVPMLLVQQAYCKRYFRRTIELDDEPDVFLINYNADDEAGLWINDMKIPVGMYRDTWSNIETRDITPFLHKGKNLIAVELINESGYGRLIVQGNGFLKNGQPFEIRSDSSWKTFDTGRPGWWTTAFDDSHWNSAETADLSDEQNRLQRTPSPFRTEYSGRWIMWRLDVPPAAYRLYLPGLSGTARLWIDDRPASRSGEMLDIPRDAKSIFISTRAGDGGCSRPAAFICRGSAPGFPGSWLNLGLRRFTGFMDYDIDFEVRQKDDFALLDLGRVQHMAEVWINGEKVGDSLWPPFLFDISGVIRSGENHLRIRVGNLVLNMMGIFDDTGELRRWGWRGTPPDSCFDAGLFGPVKLVSER